MEVESQIPGNPLLSVLATQTEDQYAGIPQNTQREEELMDVGYVAEAAQGSHAAVTEVPAPAPAKEQQKPQKPDSLEDDDAALMDEDVSLNAAHAEPDQLGTNAEDENDSGHAVARRRLGRLKRLDIASKSGHATPGTAHGHAELAQHATAQPQQQEPERKKKSRVVVKSAVYDEEEEEESMLVGGLPAAQTRRKVCNLLHHLRIRAMHAAYVPYQVQALVQATMRCAQ